MRRPLPGSITVSSVRGPEQRPSSTDRPESSSSLVIPLLAGDVAIISPSGLHVSDLELLHHYTTVTYKTLPTGSPLDRPDLWQTQVVQLGFQHEFLLRGILAVSALHMCHLSPTRRDSLALCASKHQSIALGVFQDTLNQVDVSNCVAIFAFSCITVVLTFASPRSSGNVGFQKDLFDWFHMIRGCNSVLQTQWDTVSHSFLAPLLKKGMVHETAASHNIPDCNRVTDLLRLCATGSLTHEDQETANAYALAIHELLNAYTQVSILMDRKQDFVPVIFVWPVSIPQRYLDMLRDRQPEAMIILAYYAVLLRRVDNQWFMHGWARYLVTLIHAALDEEWHEWLTWPREMTSQLACLLNS
jgi:hypothetical protein